MDTNAARRARQKAIKADLADAYHDDEASPPEWVDLLADIREKAASLPDEVASEVEWFVSEPDIRSALARREIVDESVRARVDAMNRSIRRLNLIAPNTRFMRATVDADQLLRPLYRTRRRTASVGDAPSDN